MGESPKIVLKNFLHRVQLVPKCDWILSNYLAVCLLGLQPDDSEEYFYQVMTSNTLLYFITRNIGKINFFFQVSLRTWPHILYHYFLVHGWIHIMMHHSPSAPLNHGLWLFSWVNQQCHNITFFINLYPLSINSCLIKFRIRLLAWWILFYLVRLWFIIKCILDYL